MTMQINKSFIVVFFVILAKIKTGMFNIMGIFVTIKIMQKDLANLAKSCAIIHLKKLSAYGYNSF